MPRIIEINFYTRSIDFILNVLYLQKKKKNKIEYLSITKKSKIETKIISMIPRNKESMENLSASIVEVVARGIYRVHRTRARNFYPVRDHTIFLFFFFFLFLSAPSTRTCIAFTCIDPYTRVCQRKLFPLTYESGQTIHCKSGMGS